MTVHDLIFERYPELYPPIDRRIYAWKTRRAAERADLVVAVSEQTRQDLVEFYGVEPSRIRVVYQGCRPAFQAEPAPGADEAEARRLGLPDRFLLCVGTVERRKNLELLVQALAGLPEVPLLVVGRETRYAGEVRRLARRLGVEGRLRFIESASAESLATLYRRCTVSVYPSRFEGFGIPIIEALFCGAPVVTTAGGVFPEAGGPGRPTWRRTTSTGCARSSPSCWPTRGGEPPCARPGGGTRGGSPTRSSPRGSPACTGRWEVRPAERGNVRRRRGVPLEPSARHVRSVLTDRAAGDEPARSALPGPLC